MSQNVSGGGLAEGASPPSQQDHPFVSRGRWWDLCAICRLAEAAHVRSASAQEAGLVTQNGPIYSGTVYPR